MNAVARLAVVGSALFLGVQVARWEPGLAFPLGVIAALTVGLWILRAYQAQVDAYRELDDASDEAAGRVLGREFIAERHDRREVRR
ncbi:hypothetical protein [Tsukamurella sp. NPDC003166]|uniref:hypothetical protein n=1 Tax=Tsukamurella sp. NPDC003166 TaxID=3154444 RepID=UPI0033A9A936